MFDTKRQDGENEYQYLWRIGQAKDAGILDLSWEQIAELANREFREDESEYRCADAYRKPYQMAKRYFEADAFKQYSDDDSYFKELELKKQELEKEKVKTRDERTELRRVIREEARKESYLELVLREIDNHTTTPLEYDENKKFTGVLKSNNDMIVSLFDLHVGIEIDNSFNKYNENVLKERFNSYLDKIFEVFVRHGSENVHVIISEIVSGLIHNALRIENNKNLIEQFLLAMDCISQFLAELSCKFESVNVYVCPGNHSRLMQNKEDCLKGENMDNLIIPFLSAKLQNFENIYFHTNNVEESVAIFLCRGKVVMASHGDKDTVSNVVQRFTLMFGKKPDLVYLGHRHTNKVETVYDTKVIQSGCLSGTDNYALDKRLVGKPSQTISIVNEKGLDCLYDVTFDTI